MENTNLYKTNAYRRSRAAYAAQCMFEYFVAILVSDAYLAKLLTQMGLSDSTIGIISSFISAAFLFQLGSLFLVQRIKNIKRTATLFNTVSSLLFMCLYLLPFSPFGQTSKTVLVMTVILAAYFCNYIVTSVIFKWGNSFVEPTKRGTYSAGKEMLSLISGIVFTLVVGHIFDGFENHGDIRGGFIFIAVAIFITTIMNFICLLSITPPKQQEEYSRVPFKEVMANTFGNKNFLKVVILTSMWAFAQYMTIGFLGIYKTKDLLFSVGTIQIINMIANLGRFTFSMPLGKFSNRHGFSKGLEFGYVIAAVGFFINIFCTPNTRWFIIIFTLLYNISLAAVTQNQLNILYSYVKSDYFVQGSAIRSSIAGIVGFAASLLGSRILAAIQANGNRVFGIPMYGQQFLSLISFIIAISAILFAHFTIANQKRMIQ